MRLFVFTRQVMHLKLYMTYIHIFMCWICASCIFSGPSYEFLFLRIDIVATYFLLSLFFVELGNNDKYSTSASLWMKQRTRSSPPRKPKSGKSFACCSRLKTARRPSAKRLCAKLPTRPETSAPVLCSTRSYRCSCRRRSRTKKGICWSRCVRALLCLCVYVCVFSRYLCVMHTLGNRQHCREVYCAQHRMFCPLQWTKIFNTVRNTLLLDDAIYRHYPGCGVVYVLDNDMLCVYGCGYALQDDMLFVLFFYSKRPRTRNVANVPQTR